MQRKSGWKQRDPSDRSELLFPSSVRVRFEADKICARKKGRIFKNVRGVKEGRARTPYICTYIFSRLASAVRRTDGQRRCNQRLIESLIKTLIRTLRGGFAKFPYIRDMILLDVEGIRITRIQHVAGRYNFFNGEAVNSITRRRGEKIGTVFRGAYTSAIY